MIIDEIVAKKKLTIKNIKEKINDFEKQISVMPKARSFSNAIKSDKLSVIAEVKKASPSKGIISDDFDYLNIAKIYENKGANALSVLTEEHFFMGKNEYLSKIKKEVSIPILRKDFIISPYQIAETRAIGADAILLIAAILKDKELKDFLKIANDYSLDCLFEAHNEDELKRIIQAGAKIVGINNRNLKTFEIDLHNFCSLSNNIPNECIKVAESGIFTKADAHLMRMYNADAILVGEALMRNKFEIFAE